MIEKKGFRSLPLSLKVVFVLSILWAFGSVMNMSNLVTNGLPFMGVFVFGIAAASVAIVLDIIGPIIFLYGAWNKKSWAPKVAYAYMGIFILNSVVAFFTVRETLGIGPVTIPGVVTIVFVSLIYRARSYFE